ncbi:WbqC family protein, partial [candidate division WOR-3 bacterium]|nr:WbqC family protein [candidate division WOR-3 bacterium]
DTPISGVLVKEGRDWRDRVCGQLVHYKKKAPYHEVTAGLVRECLDNDEPSLARLNVFILDKVCAYLGIRFRYEFFSEMKLDLGPVGGPGDWALRISEALGASEYVNPPGGEALFDKAKFKAVGIKLTIHQFENMTYSCNGYGFEPGLSIIDVLMWNSPSAILQHLKASEVNQEHVEQPSTGT